MCIFVIGRYSLRKGGFIVVKRVCYLVCFFKWIVVSFLVFFGLLSYFKLVILKVFFYCVCWCLRFYIFIFEFKNFEKKGNIIVIVDKFLSILEIVEK